MGSIPSSEAPGLKNLHERATAALDRRTELRDVDFKRSAAWDELRWKIIRTCLAMGNLRDGGLILIGVAETDGKVVLTGISQEHLDSEEVRTTTPRCL